jgi:hypothetical protein
MEDTVKEFYDLAAIAFAAYKKQAGGKTWDGKDIPPFAEVGELVQGNWCAAVKAVVEATAHGEDGVIHVVTEEDSELLAAGCKVGEEIFAPDSAIIRPGDVGCEETVAECQKCEGTCPPVDNEHVAPGCDMFDDNGGTLLDENGIAIKKEAIDSI